MPVLFITCYLKQSHITGDRKIEKVHIFNAIHFEKFVIQISQKFVLKCLVKFIFRAPTVDLSLTICEHLL